MDKSMLPHQLVDLINEKANKMNNLVIKSLLDDLCSLEVKNIKQSGGQALAETELATELRLYIRNKLILHKLKRNINNTYHQSIDDYNMFYQRYYALYQGVQEQKKNVRALIQKEKTFFKK